MRLSFPRVAPRASVTVVVPCYNYGHFLRRTVDSILQQADVNTRVIIVDDASPDGSADIARAIAAEDGRVTVLIHPNNKGHIATYNDGFALVKTEFVSLVSADDLVAPGALGRATRLMQVHPRVGMVYGAVVDFEDEDTPTDDYRWGHETWSIWKGCDWFRSVVRRGKNRILSPEVVMRTSALQEVGDYNPLLPHSGDLEYWLRTAARWDVGRINGRAQAYYRVHGANMHIRHFGATADDLRERRKAFATIAGSGLADVIQHGSRAERIAVRALAREALHDACRRLDRGAAPGSVTPLVEFAREELPRIIEMRSGVAVMRRLRRAEAGIGPALSQRAIEYVRSQLDRVRWKGRGTFGIGNMSKRKAKVVAIEATDA